MGAWGHASYTFNMGIHASYRAAVLLGQRSFVAPERTAAPAEDGLTRMVSLVHSLGSLAIRAARLHADRAQLRRFHKAR